MGKYIKEFSNHTEYEEFVDQVDFDLQTPNVSLCNRQNEVHYSPYEKHDYSQDYLTFEILNGGTLQWTQTGVRYYGKYIQYSIDNGVTWTQIYSKDDPTLNVTSGQRILFKGNESSYSGSYNYTDSYGSHTVWWNTYFSGTATFNVSGNIKYVLNNYTISGTTHALQGFFEGSNIINAENLILPFTTLTTECYAYMFFGCSLLKKAPKLSATILAENCYKNMFYNCSSLETAPTLSVTTLATGCYAGMFHGCKSLVTAPALLATTLVSNCYQYMFENCSKLNYIKALFTTTPSTSYTQNWVSGVASSGTFVKNSSASWTTTGVNGIPSGWTIQTASS